jgi:hypothetical protein
VSVEELLQELNQRGVILAAEGERLTYRAPRGVLTDNLRREIANHKPRLLPLLRRGGNNRPVSAEDVARMTLAEFARSGRVVRVRSRLLGEDIWWVANESLRGTVPDPTRAVYTAGELRHLVNISPQDLINIHRIKKTFGGEIEN